MPDTGVVEAQNISVHPGFLAAGNGGILDDPMFANADFTAGGYEFLAFTFQEVANAPAPTGMATVTLSADASEISFTVVAVNLTGPATAMHLHTGAAGVAGPVAIDIGDTIVQGPNGVLTAMGTRPITPAQLQSLRDGNLYINIHTGLNAPGEIRGQILGQ